LEKQIKKKKPPLEELNTPGLRFNPKFPGTFQFQWKKTGKKLPINLPVSRKHIFQFFCHINGQNFA